MNISIEIHFISADNKIMQRDEFPLRRRKPEEVAFEWLKQIRREMPYFEEVVLVKADGEDITELVRKFDEAPLD
ncbi:hypothetical protein BIV60_17080 [Bacillus sp. MUM 116]|uniref:hypothetical protein n=1 Tax=Bacillus sp. MUM 116 TaxID=1678002 RepID=UPI0008F55BAF|nr:hypothetical protein [Bacillus sp. MUM 116]OIK11968.1 hypothetical protein BIV60_17080 [Bacillus sp. MUM 116]